jgi:pyruvate formate lyase activating enzyme
MDGAHVDCAQEVVRSVNAETGICFQVQRYATHDGPGIRTTVFLKGCPLACPWCHNPEGRLDTPEVHLLPDRCIACGSCIAVCPDPPDDPTDTAAPSAAAYFTAPRPRCIRCGACVEACPTEARRLVGRVVTVAELLDQVERDRPFYEVSGGGVTFSGGEPMLQASFLIASLEGCHRRGLHAAVDTCGYAEPVTVLEVARLAHLILYDLKTLDEDRHREATGVALRPIVRNLQVLDGTGVEVWIRVPLIPGMNDDDRSLDTLGRFVRSLQRIRRVHLLPYHRVGFQKYERMHLAYDLAGVEPPTSARIAAAAERLAGFGLDARIGG